MALYNKDQDVWIRHHTLPGPDGLITGAHDAHLLELAAGILTAYTKAPDTKAPDGTPAPVRMILKDKTKILEVLPFSTKETTDRLLA